MESAARPQSRLTLFWSSSWRCFRLPPRRNRLPRLLRLQLRLHSGLSDYTEDHAERKPYDLPAFDHRGCIAGHRTATAFHTTHGGSAVDTVSVLYRAWLGIVTGAGWHDPGLRQGGD